MSPAALAHPARWSDPPWRRATSAALGETTMAIFVIGGTGFIGIRVIPLLVSRGETVVCMDINPNAPSFAGLGDKVTVVRGDVTQFDDVIGTMEASKADRVINLSYNLGQDLPPHRATKLNIVGMDTCF